MSDVQQYLDLIPSANSEKPDFMATVSLNCSVQVRVQNLLASMIPIFDLDTAIGDQLDIIGEWVGISRNVAIPISGVFFTWDGVDYSVGWDYGTWQPSTAPTTITVLPDDSYRVLIRAKIAANRWDGTTDGAYAIWEDLFTQFTILIGDRQDMSYDLAVVGGIVDSLTRALITGGYIPLKPEGVRVNSYYFPVDSGLVFAWDVENTYLGGWDSGKWAYQFSPT
jgi:hypothetical protein